MTLEARERVLAAARAGRISFYVDPTHEETSADKWGEPKTTLFLHGVCSGCVTDAADCPYLRDRCADKHPRVRPATVSEVVAYLDSSQPGEW